jgi:hypothetical protein
MGRLRNRTFVTSVNQWPGIVAGDGTGLGTMLTRRGDLRRPLVGVVAVVSMACLATACASSQGDDDTPAEQAPTISASSSAPASPSTSPASDPGSLPTSFPSQQLEFTSLPKATGPVRAALATYLTFESLVRRSFRSAQLPPKLKDYANASVLSTFRSSANAMQRRTIHFEGPTSVAVTSARGNKDIVALGLCLDTSRTRQVVKGRAKPLDGPPRAQVRAVLTDQGGRWIVTEYSGNGDTC